MRGYIVAEAGHVVNVLPPIDISGGKQGDIFHMKDHAHATIIVQVGVSAAAFTKIILNSCDDVSATNAAAMAFFVYKEEAAAGDTLGARTAVAATGLTPSANDNIMYVIEVDAAELPQTQQYLQLSLTNTTNSVIASAIAILSGSRYGEEQSRTVIT
jgi:hypothetical protein